MLEGYYHRFLKMFQYIDYFIMPSKFSQNKFIEYGFIPNKVIHIPNFIELNENDIKVESHNNNYILYIGRLSSEKGVETFIKAFEKIDKIELLIAGDGPLKSELKHLASYNKRIKFLDFLQKREIYKLIKNSSIVVLPSKCYENFPYSILEAFALGKPVIGSRIGGIPELVKDGENGLLFEPGNANELAEKIKWMIAHPKERQEMGQRARELVKREYTPEMHYKQLMAVYKTALRKHSKNVN